MGKQASIIVPEGCRQVLLHACCAPCSSAIVEWLLAHEIEPVIYYYNPNIYPQEEYNIRKNESKRHAESLGIRWIDGDEEAPTPNPSLRGRENIPMEGREIDKWQARHEAWREAVCGLENEPERGRRCETCFCHRLLATAKKAQELSIPFFATTLASSRWKNLEQINAAGSKAADAANGANGANGDAALNGAPIVQFWAQNWRKDGLQERRNQLLKEYAFYNQLYCGCEFSFKVDS